MAKFLFLLLLIGSLHSCSTMMGTAAKPELRTMENIIDFPNLTKDQIYIKSNTWFVETFTSAKSVIEFSDKEAGKIIGNYIFSYTEGVYTYNVRQTIDVEIKENKVKMRFSNPMFLTTSGLGQNYNHTSYNELKTEKGVNRARMEWIKLMDAYTKFINKDSNW